MMNAWKSAAFVFIAIAFFACENPSSPAKSADDPGEEPGDDSGDDPAEWPQTQSLFFFDDYSSSTYFHVYNGDQKKLETSVRGDLLPRIKFVDNDRGYGLPVGTGLNYEYAIQTVSSMFSNGSEKLELTIDAVDASSYLTKTDTSHWIRIPFYELFPFIRQDVVLKYSADYESTKLAASVSYPFELETLTTKDFADAVAAMGTSDWTRIASSILETADIEEGSLTQSRTIQVNPFSVDDFASIVCIYNGTSQSLTNYQPNSIVLKFLAGDTEAMTCTLVFNSEDTWGSEWSTEKYLILAPDTATATISAKSPFKGSVALSVVDRSASIDTIAITATAGDFHCLLGNVVFFGKK